MNARDELAPMLELDAHRPTHREYTGGWWELACTGCDFAKGRRLSHLDWAPHNAHREEIFRDSLLVAGYRKIFDGDCGLSNVKDPTDREATEAWMRWANLVSDEEPDGIAAMKQMLTEFGYRKPRTITTAAELDVLPKASVILLAEGNVVRKDGHYWFEASSYDMPMTALYLSENDCLPATVLHDPEATR